MLKKISGALVSLLLLTTVLYAQKTPSFHTAMYVEKWQKAVTIQEAYCKNAPNDWLNLLYLADAYNAVGRPMDAKKMLQKAALLNAQPAYQLLISGRMAIIDEQRAEAVKQLKKAAKVGKKDIVARRLIGESWLWGRSRDLNQALTLLLEAEKRDNRDFQTQMDLGYCYKALSDGGNALVHFDLAQAIEPGNPIPTLLSAMVYKSAKVPAKQLEYLDKTLALNPNFLEAIRQKAEFFYYQKRDYAAAVSVYARLLELRPEVPIADKMAYVNSLFLTKQYEPTIAWVEKIINEDGSRNYLRRLSAYSYYETENYEKGKAIMDDYFSRVAAEKIIPQDFEYYAKFLQKENQDSLAAVYYEKAIELDPQRWNLYAEIGSIRYKAKDYAGAVEAYVNRLDSLQVRTALDYYQIGLAHFMLRDSADYSKAADYFTKVTEIVPYKTTGWIMKAKSLSKLEPDVDSYPERIGEFGKAKDAFDHFVTIAEQDTLVNRNKDLVSAYEYLAYYYILQKDTEQVSAYLKKLSALDPDSEVVAGIKEWLTQDASED